MPTVKRRRKTGVNRTQVIVPKSETTNLREPPKPVRGVRLKTVSMFTILFALACLGAFMAGRPPVSAAPGTIEPMERPMFIGLRTAVYQVKDLQKAKAWYAGVLGVQPYFDQPVYVGFQAGGCELGLVPVKGAEAKRQASGIAYWRVENARAAYRRLLDLGATEIGPVREVGDGILVATVHDPFGNVLGIIQDPNIGTHGD